MDEYFWFSLLSTNKTGYNKFYYIYNIIHTKSLTLNDIIYLTVEEFSSDFNTDISYARDFFNRFKNKKTENEFISLKQMGVSILLPDDKMYPNKIKLKYKYPPPLYFIGDKKLLSSQSIGISGSRNATDISLKDAYLLARDAVNKNIVVISGFARGVDEAAHKSAILNNGSTLVILPSGINTYNKNKISSIADEAVCIVSMFKPDTQFSKWSAFERNKLIANLSDLLFIIEAGSPSGSLMQGRLSLKAGTPTFVYEKNFKGNNILLNSGAIPVNRNNVSKIFDSIDFFFPFINFSKQKYEVIELWKTKPV